MKPCHGCGGTVEPMYAVRRLRCRACQTKACAESRRRNPGPYRAAMAKWRAGHPEDAKRSARTGQWKLRGIKLTWKEYCELLAAQGGRCAICHAGATDKQSLNVDHDHSFGHVRGLLCGPCNRALGYMKDSPRLLRAAAKYIESRQPTLRLAGRK